MANDIVVKGRAEVDQVQAELNALNVTLNKLEEQDINVDVSIDLDKAQKQISTYKGLITKLEKEIKLNPDLDETIIVSKLAKISSGVSELSAKFKAAFSGAFRDIDTSDLEDAQKEIAEIGDVASNLESLFQKLTAATLRLNTALALPEAQQSKAEINQLKNEVAELSRDILSSAEDIEKFGAKAITAFNKAESAIKKAGAAEKEFSQTSQTLKSISAQLADEILRLSQVVDLEEAEKGADRIKEIREQFNRLNESIDRSSSEFSEFSGPLKALNSHLDSAANKAKRLKDSFSPSETNQFAGAIDRLSKELAELNTAADLDSVQRGKRRLEELKTELIQLYNTIKNNRSLTPVDAANFNAAIGRVNSAINTADANLKKFQATGSNLGRNLGQLIGSFNSLRIATTAFLGGLLVSHVEQFARSIARVTEKAAEAQSVMVRFFAVMSDSGPEVAAKQFEFLDALTNKLGTSLKVTLDEFVKIKDSAEDAGVPLEELNNVFASISAGAVSLGLSNEQLSGTFNALNQAFSKGVLQSEELRKQLANNFPAAFKRVADGLGITTDALENQLRRGLISAREAALAFSIAIQEDVVKGLEQASQRAEASIVRMQNAIFKAFAGIGEDIAPALKNLSDEVVAAFSNPELINAFSASLSGVINVASELTKVFTGLSTVFGIIRQSFSILPGPIQEATISIAKMQAQFAAAALPGGQLILALRDLANESREAKSDIATLETQLVALKNASGGPTKGAIEALLFVLEKTKGVLPEPIEVVKNEELKSSKQILEEMKKSLEDLRSAENNDFLFGKELEKAKKELDDLVLRIQAINLKGVNPLSEFAVQAAEDFLKLKEEYGDVILVIPELAEEFRKIESSLNPLTLELIKNKKALEDEKKLLESFGGKPVAEIKKTIEAFKEYVTAVEEGGNVTKEQAEAIGTAIERITEDINLLPESQRESLEEYKGFLEEIKKKYEEFGKEAVKAADKAEKAVDKSVKEQIKDFDALSKSLRTAYDNLIKLAEESEKTRSNNLKEGFESATKSVQELEAQVRALESQGTLSFEDSEQLNILKRQLSDARAAAREFKEDLNFEEAQQGLDDISESGREFKDTILDLIENNKEFRESFRELGDSSQQTIESIIERYSQLADQGELTKQDIDELFNSISQVFREAGQLDFTAPFDNARRSADSLKQALNDINTESITENIAGPIEKAAEAIKPAADKIDEQLNKIVTTVNEKGETLYTNLADTTDRLIEGGASVAEVFEVLNKDIDESLENTSQNVEQKTDQIAESTSTIGDGVAESAQTGVDAISKLSEAISKLTADSESISVFVEAVKAAINSLAEADFSTPAEGLNLIAEPLKIFAEAVSVVAQNKELFIAAMTEFFEAVKNGVEGEHLSKFTELMTQLAEPLKTIAEDFDTISDSVSDIIDSAPAMVESLETINDAVAEIVDGDKLSELADQVDEFSDRLSDSQDPLDDFADALGDAAENIADIIEQAPNFVGSLADMSLGIRDNIGEIEELNVQLDAMQESLAAIKTDIDYLGTQGVAKIMALKASVDALTESLNSAATAASNLATAIASTPEVP